MYDNPTQRYNDTIPLFSLLFTDKPGENCINNEKPQFSKPLKLGLYLTFITKLETILENNKSNKTL
jgi:hypothetical protein